MRTFKLEPLPHQQKSFNNKATIVEDEETLKLVSYTTTVAIYHKSSTELEVFGTYSNTTVRHLKAFINRYTPYYIQNTKDLFEFIK